MAHLRSSPYNRDMNDSFYRDVAPLYDLEFDEFDADLDLYRGYAEIVGSPILELGCGTGRLLVPLAEAGYDVIGIDSSHEMLDLARKRVADSGLTNAELIHGDMRELHNLASDCFRLVFCAVNSFLHLESRDDQLATLEAARRVLDDRGVLVIDVFHPTPSALIAIDDRFTLDGDWCLPDATRVNRFSQRRTHPADQLIETQLIFDHVDADGRVTRTMTSYRTRYVHHFEMLGLLDSAGFELEGVYGSYALDPLEDASSSMIFVAHRK
ncbi:MAG: class I SAM-dependent methyltransferase [Nitrolancea sp.]